MDQPYYEIAIVGEEFENFASEIRKTYLPNTIFAGTVKEGEIPLLQNRFVEGRTLAYVCLQGACKLPLEQSKEVLALLQY